MYGLVVRYQLEVMAMSPITENLTTLWSSWGLVSDLRSPQTGPNWVSVLCNLWPLSWALEPRLRSVVVLGTEMRQRKRIKVEIVRNLGIDPDLTHHQSSVFPHVKWDQVPLEYSHFLIIYDFCNSKALPLPYKCLRLPFPRLGILIYFICPSSFPMLFSLSFLNTF